MPLTTVFRWNALIRFGKRAWHSAMFDTRTVLLEVNLAA